MSELLAWICPECGAAAQGDRCPSCAKAKEAERPDWVVCVADRDAEAERKKLSWCHKPIGGAFAFTGVDHAALNGRRRGRLVVCPECLAMIMTALRNGYED